MITRLLRRMFRNGSNDNRTTVQLNTKQRRHGRRLSFESVERRDLLTAEGFGACMADVDDRGRASIVCDEENNYLNIAQVGDGEYTIDGNGTSINGSDDPITLFGVERGVTVNFGEGEDMGYFDGEFPSLNVNGIGRLDVQLGGSIGFESDGNVRVKNKGFVSLYAYSVIIGRDFEVETPGGGDGMLGGEVNVEYATIGRSFRVNLRNPAIGVNQVTMHHVYVARDIFIESHGGLDAHMAWIEAENARINYKGGPGNIDVMYGDFSRLFQIKFCNTAEEDESYINVMNTDARVISITACPAVDIPDVSEGERSDSGREYVVLSGVNSKSAVVRLGSNDDSFSFENSDINKLRILMDGGNDTCTDGGGNNIGKLIEKGCEAIGP